MCGCVWEKKGLTCYQSDTKCIRAGEYYINLSTTESQRVALVNVGCFTEIRTIRSILDTYDPKSGSYRRGFVPRRKNCPCDLMMRCSSADFTDGTARTSIIRHSSMSMLPSESSNCHTNLGTTIYILVCFISWSGHRLMPVIMRIMRISGTGLIWTPCVLLMTPKEYPLHRVSTFHYFLFKCIRVPIMSPEITPHPDHQLTVL